MLFLVVDDMRPMTNHAYNFSLAHTPNLDSLSKTGLTFTRAYCQYSFCSPSRNSFMSGRRPDTTKVRLPPRDAVARRVWQLPSCLHLAAVHIPCHSTPTLQAHTHVRPCHKGVGVH